MGLRKRRSLLTKAIVGGKTNKDDMSRERSSYNYFVIFSAFGLFVTILGGTILLSISLANWLLVIGLSFIVGATILFFHENKDNLLRVSIVFLISGLVFVLIELIEIRYLAALLLGIPISLYIKNRSRKHLYIPTIVLVSAASYLFIMGPHYIFSWLALMPLVFVYYQTRYKVSSKPTYINDLSPYQQRKKLEEQKKNF